MRVDRDRQPDAVPAQPLVHAARLSGDDGVETEVVGERPGVEVVLVEASEADAGVAEERRDRPGHARRLVALAARRPPEEGGDVHDAIDAAPERR